MKTIEINERALLIALEACEAKKYFPKGEFDIADRDSRVALRSMLRDACEQTGRDLSEKVEINAFGDRRIGFNIFCIDKGGENT